MSNNEGIGRRQHIVSIRDEMVYASLTVTQAEIRSEWSNMKKEGIVYCVRDMPGWVGIYQKRVR